MNLFEFKDYRRAFAHLFERERARGHGWSTLQLAEQIRVQPSHLTNVIKGRAHFSSDQIHAIGAALALAEDETHYLDLLMEWERAQFAARKEKLHRQVQELRDKNLRAERQLQAKENRLSAADREKYYLDPNIELMHLYLGMKRVSTEPREIAKVWGFDLPYTVEILEFLQEAGLAKASARGWKVHSIHQHLPRTSPLCKPQQLLKRLRALEVIQRTRADDVYSMNLTLTMSQETRVQIQARFLDFIRECEKLVLASDPDDIYNLQFDLFPWL